MGRDGRRRVGRRPQILATSLAWRTAAHRKRTPQTHAPRESPTHPPLKRSNRGARRPSPRGAAAADGRDRRRCFMYILQHAKACSGPAGS